MVRVLGFWCLAIAVIAAGAQTANAGAITFTGNVAQDFGYVGNPMAPTSSSLTQQGDYVNIQTHTAAMSGIVGQPSAMTSAGLVSGLNVNSVAVSYDPTNDTLYVGIKTFGVAGDVYGKGTPGQAAPSSLPNSTDTANFSGNKSIAVGFSPVTAAQFSASSPNPPTPTIVAGIPSNKAQAGSGLDGFTVAQYSGSQTPGPGKNYDLIDSFGKAIGSGTLAFQPSAATPGFEFSIKDFSQLLGYNPLLGFAVNVQTSDVDGLYFGPDYVSTYEVFPEAQTTPEPATWLAWTVVCGAGAAWRFRRSRTARVA